MSSIVVQILSEDPELAGSIAGERLDQARRELIAAVMDVDAGPWQPSERIRTMQGAIGLLMLDGLIVRRVGREGRYSAELLGPGDILRPWQGDGEDGTLPFRAEWRAIAPARLTILDKRFAGRLGPYPEVMCAITARVMQRSRALAINMAIAHHFSLERRLIMLLWHLADRWGRVTPSGIAVPLPLTHEILADLVAAQRPSVTMTLGRLQEAGLISRPGIGFVLHGDPPDEFAAETEAPREATR
jgi:CRP/FNR family cyclic AMP-dependent transcriptional regulator